MSSFRPTTSQKGSNFAAAAPRGSASSPSDDRCLLDHIRASDTSTPIGTGSCDGLRVFAERYHYKKSTTPFDNMSSAANGVAGRSAQNNRVVGVTASTRATRTSTTTTTPVAPPLSSSKPSSPIHRHHAPLFGGTDTIGGGGAVVEDSTPQESVLPVYGAFKVLDAKRVSSNYSHQTISYGRHNLAASLQSQLLVFPPEATVPTFGQAVVARGSWEVFPDATEGLSVLDSYAPFVRHRVGLRDALKASVPQGMITDTDTKKSNHKHLAKLVRRRERRGGQGPRSSALHTARGNDDSDARSDTDSSSSSSSGTSSGSVYDDGVEQHRTHRQYPGFSPDVESDDEEDESIPQHLFQSREMKMAERHTHLSFRQWSAICVSYADDSLVAAGDVDGGLGIFRLRPDAASIDGSSQLELVHCVDTVERIGQLADQYELATRGNISIGHHLRSKSTPAHPGRNLLMSQVFGGITSLTSTPLQPTLFYGGCCGRAVAEHGGRLTSSSAQSLVLPTVLVFDIRAPSLLVQRTPIHYLGVSGSTTQDSGVNHLASGRVGGVASKPWKASPSSVLAPNLVTSLAINCTGSLLSVGTSQGGVGVSTVSDIATCVARLSMDGGFGSESSITTNNTASSSTAPNINSNISSCVASAVQTWGGGVKALAWSPVEPHELTIGGGTGDGILRTYNLHERRLVRRVETGSQIVQVSYSAQGSCLVTTHGLETKPIYTALLSSGTFQERLLSQQQHRTGDEANNAGIFTSAPVPLSTEALRALTSRAGGQQQPRLHGEMSAASLTRSSSSLSSLSSSSAHSPVEVSVGDFDGAFSSATATTTPAAAARPHHSSASSYHQPRPSSSTIGGGGGMGLARLASSVDASDPLRFGTAAGAALAAEAAASRGMSNNSPLMSMSSLGLEGTLSVRDVRRESSSNGLVGLRQSSSMLFDVLDRPTSSAAAVHATVLRNIHSSDRLSPLDGGAGGSGRTESPYDRRSSSHPVSQQVTIPPNSVVVWSHGSTLTAKASTASSLHPRAYSRGAGDDGSPTIGTRAWNSQTRDLGMLRSSSTAASSVRSSSVASCSSSEDGARNHHLLRRKTTATMNVKVNKLLIPDICDPETTEEASGWVVSTLLKHHSSRPLTLSRCRRDGNSGVLASVAGDTDGTLRLWRLFDPVKKTANRAPYITPQGERYRYRPPTSPLRHANTHTVAAAASEEEMMRIAGLFSTARFEDEFIMAAEEEFATLYPSLVSSRMMAGSGRAFSTANSGGGSMGEEYGQFDPSTTAALRASSRPPSSTTMTRPFTPPPPLSATCTAGGESGNVATPLSPPPTTSTSFPPPPQLLPLLPHHRGLMPSSSDDLRSPIRDETAHSSILFNSTPFKGGGHASMGGCLCHGTTTTPASSTNLKDPFVSTVFSSTLGFGSGFSESCSNVPLPLRRNQHHVDGDSEKENNSNMNENLYGGGKTRPPAQYHQPFKNFINSSSSNVDHLHCSHHADDFQSIFNLKLSENRHVDTASPSHWGREDGEHCPTHGGRYGGGFVSSSSSLAFEFGLASSSGRPPKPPAFNMFGGGDLDKPRMR